MPYLIQAVVAMREPGGFTASTVGYWAALLDKLWIPPALADRLAPYRGARATDVQLGICGIGVALLAGSDDALQKRVLAAIERCGLARSTALGAMLAAAETYVREHDVWAELRTLGEARGAEHWLL